MQQLLEQLSGLPHWQIGLIAAYLLLQGCVVPGVPEEVVITTLGMLWSQGRIAFAEAFAFVLLGLLPANAFTVVMTDRFGPQVLKRRPFRWMIDLQTAQPYLAQVRKWGGWIVPAARFTPIVRGPIYAAIGLSKFGVLRFMAFDALAACVEVPAFLLVGAYIGKNSESLTVAYAKIGAILGALLIGAIVFKLTHGKKLKG